MSRPLPESPATTVAACGDAAAAGGAVASACQNRSSPVRRRKRRERLRGLSAQNVQSVRNGLNGLNSQNGRDGRAGRNGPSVPNTGRRRDISPSFCRENQSQNINGWPRPGPRLRARGLRLRHLTSPQRPSRRFFPKMSRFLLPQIQRNRSLRLAQKRRRTFTGSGLRTVQALGTANSSAFTR